MNIQYRAAILWEKDGYANSCQKMGYIDVDHAETMSCSPFDIVLYDISLQYVSGYPVVKEFGCLPAMCCADQVFG